MTDFNIADINAPDAWGDVYDKPFADIFAGSSIYKARFEFKRFLRDLYVTPRSVSFETFTGSAEYEVSLFEHTCRKDESDAPTRYEFQLSVRLLIDKPQLLLSVLHDGSSYIGGTSLPAITDPKLAAAYEARQYAFNGCFWMLCRKADVEPGRFSQELCHAVFGYEDKTLAEVRKWLILTIQCLSDAIGRATWLLDSPSPLPNEAPSETDYPALFSCSAWISVSSTPGTAELTTEPSSGH
jgi:hypothetical protein